MPKSVTRLSRRELYEMVWQTPMRQLAPRFGLSDVGLSKVCRRHDVPRPPVGYWAKVEHGKRVRRIPLPKGEDCEIVIIQSEPRPQSTSVAASGLPDDIEVPTALSSPHRLVRAARSALRQEPANERGLLPGAGAQVLDICVSKRELDRALRVMDSLVKSAETAGWQVSVGVGTRPGTRLEPRGGDPTSIRIVELVNRAKVPSPGLQGEDRWWLTSQTRYTYSPSGRLRLEICEPWTFGMRGKWADGTRQRVEESVGPFLRSVAEVSKAIRHRRLESERTERDREQALIREAALRAAQQQKKARVDGLLRDVASWVRAEEIRSYIDAVRRVAEKVDGEIAPSSEFGQWLAWAEEQADRLDPLRSNPSQGASPQRPERKGEDAVVCSVLRRS